MLECKSRPAWHPGHYWARRALVVRRVSPRFAGRDVALAKLIQGIENVTANVNEIAC